MAARSKVWVCGLSPAEMWVRMPSGAWMFVYCECCVLSGRGLCDELTTRPEESYRLWCVVVCDLETSWMMRPWPAGGCRAKNKQRNKQIKSITSVDRCLCKTISTVVASILKKPCLCLNFFKLPEMTAFCCCTLESMEPLLYDCNVRLQFPLKWNLCIFYMLLTLPCAEHTSLYWFFIFSKLMTFR